MEEIRYQLATPDQAGGIVGFIREVYGESYPSDFFYDAREIERLIRAGLLHSSIALNGDDEIVGHLAILREDPNDVTVDGITGMVLPRYRGQNIMSKLGVPVASVVRKHGIIGLHLYAVTMHTISQRKTLENGAAVTGILLADWGSDLTVSGFETGLMGERMPMLMMFFPFGKPGKRKLHVSRRYRGVVEQVYRELEFECSVEADASIAPEVGSASTSAEVRKTRQKAAHLRFSTLGEDWERHTADFLEGTAGFSARYVDVPLGDPAAPMVLEALNRRGWYFGGLLIERGGDDLLRMQCSKIQLETRQIELSSSGKTMLQYVLKDRDECSGS